MFVFVLNRHKQPLMPCSPAKARRLLWDGKAKVVRRTPFTIQLLYGASGYTQAVVAGMDTGSTTIGSAAIANGQILYQAETTLRTDVSKKMRQRATYRRTRRGRKTRYRPARWQNRASMRRVDRLAPSIRSKVESHLRERRLVESLLPVTQWHVELASFDIHKITTPDVEGIGYQEGAQKGFYNLKAYVLSRDKYTCRSGRPGTHAAQLHVHHIVFRSAGGSNTPANLVTLCETCHGALHAGVFVLKGKRSPTKHATEVGMVKAALAKSAWNFTPTYGYETKWKREQCLGWAKSHAADAVAICCSDGETVQASSVLYLKRHVAKGDYQQTKGPHSNIRIPTGKLFGLRKFDLIVTSKGAGFVKGKRTTGRFSISQLDGTSLHASVDVRQCQRVSARSTTLVTQAVGPQTDQPSFLPVDKSRGFAR